MGEPYFKRPVARAGIVIIDFVVAASKKPEEGPWVPPMPKRSNRSPRLNFLRVAIFAFCQRREAGTLWHKQGCSKWCAACALPRVAACAAAAVLTSVLARAESFMLALAGYTLWS